MPITASMIASELAAKDWRILELTAEVEELKAHIASLEANSKPVAVPRGVKDKRDANSNTAASTAS